MVPKNTLPRPPTGSGIIGQTGNRPGGSIRGSVEPREPRFVPCSPFLIVCLVGFTLFIVGFVIGRLTR